MAPARAESGADVRPEHRAWRVREAGIVIAALGAVATAFWLGIFVRRFQLGFGSWGTFDLEMYFYPKFAYGAAALAAGRVPLWNANEFCGLPFLATAQVAALYPVKNLVFWLFAPPLALHVNYVVHLVLAGACAWAYARWLGQSAAAAAVVAVMWAFNSYFVLSVYHPMRIMALAWVPLVLLLYGRALARRTVGSAALAGAAFALQASAGYPPLTLCLIAVLAVVTAVHLVWTLRDGGRLVGLVGAAAASAAFASAFAAPQLLPLAELVGETSRKTLVAATEAGAEMHLGAGTIPAVLLGTAVSILFHAGPAAGFSLGGLLFGQSRARWLQVASLVLLQSGPYLGVLPGFGLVRLSWLIWPSFAFLFTALLVAEGIDQSRRGDPRVTVTVVAVPVVAAIVAYVSAPFLMLRAVLGLGIAAVVLAAATTPRRRALASAAACIAAVLTLAALDAPYRRGAKPYPMIVRDPALHAAVEAAAGGGRLFAPSILGRGEHLFSDLRLVSGAEASFRPARVGRLLDTASLVERFVGRGPKWDLIAAHRPLLDLLGVSLIVGAPGDPVTGFAPGPPLPDGRATWRNPTALPRAYIVHRVRTAASAEAAFAAVTDPAFRPAEEAVVEGDAPTVAPGTGAATLVSDQPERVAIDATVDAPALLVLTDAHFPGWQAELDGHTTPILRTNYAFRGIALTPGMHHIVFHYRPWSFRVGIWLAAAALLIAFPLRARRTGPPEAKVT